MIVNRRYFLLSTAVLSIMSSVSHAKQTPLSIEAYFTVCRPRNLALSSDGRWIVYEVLDGAHSRFFVQRTTSSTPRLLSSFDGQRLVGWMPGGRELAFVSQTDTGWRVDAYDVKNGSSREIVTLLKSPETLVFAPNGTDFAYLVNFQDGEQLPLGRQLRESTIPVIIDIEAFGTASLSDPNFDALASLTSELWVARAGQLRKIGLPESPISIKWSPCGAKLSIVSRPRIASRNLINPTSVGVLEFESGRYMVLAQGTEATPNDPAISYEGGEWKIDANDILIRRKTWTHPWTASAFAEWTWTDPTLPNVLSKANWQEIETVGARFHPRPNGKLWLESIVRAHRGLYEAKSGSLNPVSHLQMGDGANRQYTFSEDGESTAFVHEGPTLPPEIYVALKGRKPRRMSILNAELSAKAWPLVKMVEWPSKDGTEVSGWLMTPREAIDAARLPLLTFVHGGPGGPYTDEFLPYFDNWPYPLEAIAARGVAILIPNYRGTFSFGRAFASPRSPDGEPIDDLISGIDALIARGIADPDRLGICGHSHGAWLGPLAMTRDRRFKAASFANGWGNMLQLYLEMTGLLNRAVLDPTIGASVYDDPSRYLTLSPAQHYRGVTAAALYETGVEDDPLGFLSLPKAGQRAGAPVEYVAYPKSGHNLSSPALMRASAELNVDWIEYWLSGRKDAAPSKSAQYTRWDAIRRQ